MKKALFSLFFAGVAGLVLAQATPQNQMVVSTAVIRPDVITPVEVLLINPTGVAGAQARLLYDPNLIEVLEPAEAGSEINGGVISQPLAFFNYDANDPVVENRKGVSFAIAGARGTTKTGRLFVINVRGKSGVPVYATTALEVEPGSLVMSNEESQSVDGVTRNGFMITGAPNAGWSKAIVGGISGSVSVLVDAAGNGRLAVVGDDGVLYLYNAANGDPAGTLDLKTAAVTSVRSSGRPVLRDGGLYVATVDGRVFRIDPATNQTAANWPVNVGAQILSTPAVLNNQVYVTDGNDRIVAYDSTSGAKGPEFALSSGQPAGTQGFSSPAARGVGDVGTIWVGGANTVFQLSANLTPLKSIDVGSRVQSAPFISPSGQVFVGADDGNVYAYDAGSGEPIGNYATGEPVQNSLFAFAGADGVMNHVVINNAGEYHTVQVTGGTVQGAAPGAVKFAGGSANNQAPIVVGQTVWVGDITGVVHGVNVSGANARNLRISASPVSSPAATSDLVYFGAADGTIVAIPAAPGSSQ